PPPRVAITERARTYWADVVHGQKTGFYLDQRDARDLTESVARGRRVLDLFAHTGGFGIAAGRGGAATLTLVESAKDALTIASENSTANGITAPVESVVADVHDFLRSDQRMYDLVIVDPPPLAKRRADVPRAARAYKDAFLHAFKRA